MKKTVPFLFISLGLTSLLGALLIGVLAGLSFAFPSLQLDQWIAFQTLRPLHVSLAVGWIWFTAVGCVFLGLRGELKANSRMPAVQFFIGFSAALLIVISYAVGKPLGREYMEFPIFITIPLLIFWILFAIQIIPTVFRQAPGKPLHQWMWLTGSAFVIFCLIEAHLWLLPHFFNNQVRDMVVQWKSYGALIGSWNMLIYGLSTYIGYLQVGDYSKIFSRSAFALYFVGFINMLFNWGHHTYLLPTAPAVRTVAYLISMIELVILWNLLRSYRSSAKLFRSHSTALQLTSAMSEFWVLANLILAILISIPAINYFTHGTHITVAHAMGATIGINTTLLLSAIMFFLNKDLGPDIIKGRTLFWGTWLGHISLFIFWAALVGAGVRYSYLARNFPDYSHTRILGELGPFFATFAVSGFGVALGFGAIGVVLLKSIYRTYFSAGAPTSSRQ